MNGETEGKRGRGVVQVRAAFELARDGKGEPTIAPSHARMLSLGEDETLHYQS